MIKAPLPNSSAGALGGANFEVIITHEDLTASVADATQTLTVPVEDKVSFEILRVILDEKFQDTADAANNSTAVVAGDGGSANRFLTSTELNVNGTEVNMKNGTGTALVYTTSDTVDFVFTPASGKTLSALNRGRVRFQCRVIDGRIPSAKP